MNHVEKLALQCGAWNQVYDNTVGLAEKRFMIDKNFDFHKFAQLVATECIAICESGTSTQMTSAGAGFRIKQHFEIKE